MAIAKKKKNVLFLHLESISRANLWQYRYELGTVWRLMANSFQFSRFFTSSTSTEMTMKDLFAGHAAVWDYCPTFESGKGVYDFYVSKRCLFRLRDREGYNNFHLISSSYSPVGEFYHGSTLIVNNLDIVQFCDRALELFASSQRSNIPFVATFQNLASHLAAICSQKDEAPGLPDKLRVGYSLLDAAFNRLFAGMAQLGLLENTIIIGYGDHGDEPWSHEFNKGYCHAIPPYASVCWAPMFIYDMERFTGGITDQLASMVDINATLWGCLFPERDPLPQDEPYCGIDLFRQKRAFAFSQNMFALQREFSDPEKGLMKGYAVTDGTYRLVVSSGGHDPAKGGMELYCDQADPENSLNLLGLFDLDDEGNIQGRRIPAEAVNGRYHHILGDDQVESIRQAFGKLKPALREFIKTKEKNALNIYDTITGGAEKIEDYAMRLTDGLIQGWGEGGDRQSREELFKSRLNVLLTIKKNLVQAEPQVFPDSPFARSKITALTRAEL